MGQVLALIFVIAVAFGFYYLCFRFVVKSLKISKESREKNTDYFVTANKDGKIRKFLIGYIVFLFLLVFALSRASWEDLKYTIIPNIVFFLFGLFFLAIGAFNFKHTFERIRKNGLFPFFVSILSLIIAFVIFIAALSFH